MKKIFVDCTHESIFKFNSSEFDQVFHFPVKRAQANSFVLSEDFLSGREFRESEHEASLLIKKYISYIENAFTFSSLEKISVDPFPRYLIEDRVLLELAPLIRSIYLVKKIKNTYFKNEEVKLYFSPEFFVSSSLINFLLKEKVIGDDLFIPNSILLKNKIREHVKNIYFFGCLIFSPLFVIAKSLVSKRIKAKEIHFNFGTHICHGVHFSHFPHSINFIIDDDKVTKDNTIFILDEDFGDEFYGESKDSEFMVVDFKRELFGYAGFLNIVTLLVAKTLSYFSHIISSAFNLKFTSVYFKAWQSTINWSLFYKVFDVKKAFLRMMIKGDLVASIFHQNNNVKNIFQYTSAGTQQIIAEKKNELVTDNLDYTHMIFDECVTDKLANDWISKSENLISEYNTYGIMMSDIVHDHIKNEKYSLREKVGLKESEKLVTFFDHSTSLREMMTFDAYSKFMEMMFEMTKEGGYRVAYKSKKNMNKILAHNPKALEWYEKAVELDDVIYLNEFKLTPFESMAMTDLIVSFPVSSVITTALSGGVKVITYDPNSDYLEKFLFHNKMKNFNSYNKENLSRLIKHWLFNVNDEDFKKFYNKEVRPFTEVPSDFGSGIETFRKYLVKL